MKPAYKYKRRRARAYGSQNVRRVLAALKKHGIEWPGEAEETYIKRQEDARGQDAWHWFLILDTHFAWNNPCKVPQVGGRNPISTWREELIPYKNEHDCYEMC